MPKTGSTWEKSTPNTLPSHKVGKTFFTIRAEGDYQYLFSLSIAAG